MIRPIKKVVVAGVSGNLGPTILEQVLESRFVITILSHQGINHTFPSEGKTSNSLDQDRETPLHKATKGYNESVEARFIKRFLLLADPGLVNAFNLFGQTALHLAALNSDLQTVELLVHYGAQVHLKDERGCTFLHYAVAESSPEVAEFLIRQDKSIVNYQDNRRMTPYHIAAMTRCNRVFVHLTEVSVANLRLSDHMGCMPLSYAPPNRPFHFSWSLNTLKKPIRRIL